MSETDLQRSIKMALEQAGFWVVRTQVRGRNGPRSVATGEPGMPDLLLVGVGYVEVKLPGGKLSQEQEAWHAKAKARGVKVTVAHSVAEAVTTANGWL